MLYQRVLTGILMGAVILSAVWYGGWPFSLLICFLAVVGFSELVKMRGFQVFSLPALLGYIGTLFFLTLGMWELPGVTATDAGSIPGIWLIGLLFLFLTISVTSKNRYTFQDMTYLFGGTVVCWFYFPLCVDVAPRGRVGSSVFPVPALGHVVDGYIRLFCRTCTERT